ncbi:hypothetical protein WISP_133419 [Willisornis vidua]|uniref:Uncharacterized protein n=1 Tax=Willisornis vidua TaxID=1566151 RepID=A0ABQ9CP41_9PASS|nr:hypothetical protein WISP_133419 [Willisornis vidua]
MANTISSMQAQETLIPTMKSFMENKPDPYTNTYQNTYQTQTSIKKDCQGLWRNITFFAAIKRGSEFEQLNRDFKKPHNPFYQSFDIFRLLSETHHVFPGKPMKSGYCSQSKRKPEMLLWSSNNIT